MTNDGRRSSSSSPNRGDRQRQTEIQETTDQISRRGSSSSNRLGSPIGDFATRRETYQADSQRSASNPELLARQARIQANPEIQARLQANELARQARIQEYRERRQQPGFESASDRIVREYRERRQQPGFESASDRIMREYRERRQQQGQNLDNSFEGRLVAFATETLMEDPDKVFPDKGPKNSHEHEMVWAIVGELSGRSYPRYNYLRNHPKYSELKDWTLNEFHKWQEENAQS
jgi:hypothetical protein